MNFFKKLAQALGIIPENRTEEINEKRSELKTTMANNLLCRGFTQDEIDEVLNIITVTEEKIQKQKDMLIGTNINNIHIDLAMKPIFQEIKKLQLKMADDIRAKIAEIEKR